MKRISTARIGAASLAASMIIGVSASARAQAWEHAEWDIAPSQSETVDMVIATNKKTGAKMRLIKTKDGTLMAVVPAAAVSDLLRGTPYMTQ